MLVPGAFVASGGVAGLVLVEHRENFPDPVAVLDRVPHRPVRPDSVEVSPAIADPVEAFWPKIERAAQRIVSDLVAAGYRLAD